ncbi:MAG: zinc dependent phospholipase C family protein [Clostridiales bacterium]|nr:zinc dependent phospholipase C family protein [Clostridiales bacterium]
MPSTYAHLYFGRQAYPLLPEQTAQAVEENRQLYDIGLHGPDIFFYYRPLHNHPIDQCGYDMHSRPGRDFFFPARTTYTEAENTEAALAYLAGFLCHYTLDSACHGYVEKKLSVSSLAHTDIENEFDRYLLQKEGRDIFHTNLTAHIIPSAENAAAIADFFPEVTAAQVQTALKSMKFYCGMICGGSFRRNVADMVLKISRCSEEMCHVVVAKKALPGSEDSNLRLEKLFGQALKDYAERICAYEEFLRGGSFPTGMEPTFGPGQGWEDIPVLPVEEERQYDIEIDAH